MLAVRSKKNSLKKVFFFNKKVRLRFFLRGFVFFKKVLHGSKPPSRAWFTNHAKHSMVKTTRTKSNQATITHGVDQPYTSTIESNEINQHTAILWCVIAPWAKAHARVHGLS